MEQLVGLEPPLGVSTIACWQGGLRQADPVGTRIPGSRRLKPKRDHIGRESAPPQVLR